MARRPTRSQRLKRLLEAGYFPAELPPPFISLDFGRFRNSLRRQWPARQFSQFKSDPEIFSIPRFGRARRRLSIVNPINQFQLSELIANNWGEIRNHLASSKVSEFQPVFDLYGQRAFFRIDFGKIEKRTNEILPNFQYSVKTDIARYYPTIYTHSLAWALHGKQYCKANLHSPAFNALLGHLLDVTVRKSQDNQSIGLPIGPDTSRVLGEIIGVAIEKNIEPLLLQFEARMLRYVDDLIIGYSDGESPERVLSVLTQAVGQFGLDINLEKTMTLGSSEPEVRDWTSILRRMTIRGRAHRQQDEIEHFFKTALHLATENEKDAVMLYAIKKSRAFRIDDENWPYYISWLLRSTRKYAACIPATAQILIESRYRGRTVPAAVMRRFIVDMITIHGPIHNIFETSWALFLAKGLNVALDGQQIAFLFVQESSVCALLLMDLNARGLIIGGLDASYWMSLRRTESLKGNMWLLAYEATLGHRPINGILESREG